MGLLKTSLTAGAIVAATAITALPAFANPIYVGYSLDGGNTINTVSSADGFNSFSVTAGGFTVSGTGTGAPITGQGALLSNSTSVSANTAGAINIYISETGNILPAASFTTSFVNASASTTSVGESTYFTVGNAAFGGQYRLSSSTVAPGATAADQTVVAPSGLTPYTLTSVYSIIYGGSGGFTTSTLNVKANAAVAAVPEPASWAMMILGMGAIGFAMRSAKRRSDEKFDAKIKRITYGAAAVM